MKIAQKLFREQRRMHLVVLARVAAAGIAFAANIVLTRVLEPKEVGLYLLALAVVAVVATLARCGMDKVVLRHTGIAHGNSDAASVRAVLRLSVLVTASASAALCLLLFFLAPIAEQAFNKPGFSAVLRSVLPAIGMMAVLTLVGLSLQGQRRSLASVVVLNVLVNGLLIGGLLALPIGTAVQAGMIYSTSAAVVMLFSWLLWSKGRPYGGPAKTQEITMPLLWHGAIPLWIVAGVQIIQQRSAQLVAGVFVSPEDVALLALAQRTALLTSLVLTAINIVIAPGLASLHDEGDAVGLRRESRKAVRQSLLGTTPMLLVMVAFPETVMGIFGEEYRDGATLLQILALGQFVNAGSGSTGYLLTMSGHERDVRNSLLVFFPVTLAAAILCTAEFGVVGGACSTAFAIMGRNLFCVYFVRKRLGFNPLVFWKP